MPADCGRMVESRGALPLPQAASARLRLPCCAALRHADDGRCCCLALLQDGLEMTWAVNVAAPFLLTGCLLDVVAERVVNVSSISAASSLDFDNLQQVPLPPCTVQLYSALLCCPAAWLCSHTAAQPRPAVSTASS